MAKKKSGLGRGLGALIPQGGSGIATAELRKASSRPAVAKRATKAENPPSAGVAEISLSLIEANPDQPRSAFGHRAMEELTESVREHGILQPLAVSEKAGGGYEVIAGERRLRAAKMAGLKAVPVIIREVTDTDKLLLALIENIQREDLNPIEEARAFRRLRDEFGLKQEAIAKQVGKARPTVANAMRLLDLPEDILDAVATGAVSAGNARALLSIDDPKARHKMFRKMLAGGVTVRDAEAKAQKTSTRTTKDPRIMAFEEELRDAYGTRVAVSNRSGRGRIILQFYSDEEFDTLLKKLLD